MATHLYQAFLAARADAKKRRIRFTLTREEYENTWNESGHAAQIGRSGDQYRLTRINLTGAFEPGNVHILTNRESVTEQWRQHHATAGTAPRPRKPKPPKKSKFTVFQPFISTLEEGEVDLFNPRKKE